MVYASTWDLVPEMGRTAEFPLPQAPGVSPFQSACAMRVSTWVVRYPGRTRKDICFPIFVIRWSVAEKVDCVSISSSLMSVKHILS